MNIKYVLGEYHDGELTENKDGLIELPDGTFARRVTDPIQATD